MASPRASGPFGVATDGGREAMKVHFLDLGTIEYDEGWPLAAAGVSTPSNPNPTSPRRKIAIIATLIDHPAAGPILFDTGAAPNFEEVWPPPVQQVFAIT